MSDELSSPLAKRPRLMKEHLTVQQIAEDRITVIAEEHWSQGSLAFSPDLVREIYISLFQDNIESLPNTQKVSLLEMSRYLELYLWPNFQPGGSIDHLISILLMFNEKFRQRTAAWDSITQDAFGGFFDEVLEVNLEQCRVSERLIYIIFLTNCFQSLETEFVRNQILKLVSLPLWRNLSSGRIKLELQDQPSLMKKWNRLLKKEAKKEGQLGKEATFLEGLLQVFLKSLEQDLDGVKTGLEVKFCERFLAFLIDLLSQLPTRRFLKAILLEKAIIIKCKMSGFYTSDGLRSELFIQLVDLLESYLYFNVDEHSGEPLTDEELLAKHYEKLTQLQRLLYKYWDNKIKHLAMIDCSTLHKPTTLRKALESLSYEEVHRLVVVQLKLVHEKDPWNRKIEFLREVFVSQFVERKSEREEIGSMPSYPTEKILYDPKKIPDIHSTEDDCVPISKLNLQFLSFHDYLVRNHQLYLLEAAYQVREEILDVVDRLGSPREENGKVRFKGWARMATPLENFKIIEVKHPKLGEKKPSSVKAEIIFNTKFMREDVKKEWDDLKEYDVLFLLSIQPSNQSTAQPMVRGCEIREIRDEQGKAMNKFPGEKTEDSGFLRTLVVSLDTAQYRLDVDCKQEEVYGEFTVLMRRKARENNFKSVLECIRDLMQETHLEFDWLHDVLLGYGLPSAAHYTHLTSTQISTLDMKDTFLDLDHVKESFPDYLISQQDEKKSVDLMELSFSCLPGMESGEEKRLDVKSYSPSNLSPYPAEEVLRNSVRFTPVQIQAIVSGLQEGLTMIVGPPGTGKTDTAVQILHLLFHNFPQQRTLLITHSNQALNDLFQKLMERDVPARYLLRLGQGEEDLETDLDFSRVGRVNMMLERRLELLLKVQELAKQFKVSEDLAYSCETAEHFWLLHVLSRWEKFLVQCHTQGTIDSIKTHFPFTDFFSSAPQPLFHGLSFEEDMKVAHGCFHHLKMVFKELEECRAFELLRGQSDRVNYLMTKQAKIVAMTCTHAALKRKEFLMTGLKYDNIVMEESGQILEIETFIPLTLQREENGSRSLKRLILIGDHNQLPPVVKHPAFQRYSRLDQSLFTRLIRLGVPYLELDAQGRCRQSLAKLFNWRYKNLSDLPSTKTNPVFQLANAGFAYDYQFIDISEEDGGQEITPTPYYYQNLAEAEFVVKVFQFMRLIGYPSQSISILTTYNGQKHLIEDIISKHCSSHPEFGRPLKIATVDKFQGQQNQFILLSLVRTKSVGHLRDVRRLIVATSRAQLGFYVFGKASLFQNCYEMKPTFTHWSCRPMKLALVKGEAYGHCARLLEDPVEKLLISGSQEIESLVNQMTLEWESHVASSIEGSQGDMQEAELTH